MSPEEIEAGKSARGQWTAKTLASWGVPWPPPKGWKRMLIEAGPGNPLPQQEENDFDYLPPAVQLEQAIAFMERRAANSHLLARAERGENSRYVKAHHMMSAVSIDLILPHARAALEKMKGEMR